MDEDALNKIMKVVMEIDERLKRHEASSKSFEEYVEGELAEATQPSLMKD